MFISINEVIICWVAMLFMSSLPKSASVFPFGNGVCSKGNSDGPAGLTDIWGVGMSFLNPLGFEIHLSVTDFEYRYGNIWAFHVSEKEKGMR